MGTTIGTRYNDFIVCNKPWTIELQKGHFNNGNLAVAMLKYNEELKCLEPIGYLSVNIEPVTPEIKVCKNGIFLDKDNLFGIKEWLKKHPELGEFTGFGALCPGYIIYPEFQFTDEALDSMRDIES